MKRTDLHTPSNSTNGEMEVICQIMEEAFKYHCEDRNHQELHRGMDALVEDVHQRAAGIEVSNPPSDRRRF